MALKKLIAGNWKMNGLLGDSKERIDGLKSFFEQESEGGTKFDLLVCPPASLLAPVKGMIADADIALGGQDCHIALKGAFTGDISAQMLQDQGCKYVIVGHSERRGDHAEVSAMVAQKARMAHEAGLVAIICLGELEGHRDTGQAEQIVGQQLMESVPDSANAENTVIAYEPVWAIGTGKVAEPEDIKQMHGFIREKLSEKVDVPEYVKILYGGSVKPSNAAEILSIENVDGALIGGASLAAEDFLGIATADY